MARQGLAFREVFGRFLVNEQARRGLGVADFSGLLGISENYLGELQRADKQVGHDMLQQILDALGMSVEWWAREMERASHAPDVERRGRGRPRKPVEIVHPSGAREMMASETASTRAQVIDALRDLDDTPPGSSPERRESPPAAPRSRPSPGK